MNGKKTTILSGTLLLPLRLGTSAVIRHNGGRIRTSEVVSIHSISPTGICFETLNTNARIPFRCERCARCCRNLENALMLDPFDIYNLSKHLREQGQEIIGTEDMLAQFAHPNLLEGIYPIFQVNTEGADHACVFLKDDRCSVYEARPQVCRMYPFGVSPGESRF